MKSLMFGIALLMLVTAMSIGCSGSGNHQVTGTVKFKGGENLKTGTVYMMKDNSESVGTIKEDGTYTMGTMEVADGVPPGEYKVRVEAYGSSEEGPGATLIDSKYNNYNTSGLTLNVDGSKTFDIEVDKAP